MDKLEKIVEEFQYFLEEHNFKTKIKGKSKHTGLFLYLSKVDSKFQVNFSSRVIYQLSQAYGKGEFSIDFIEKKQKIIIRYLPYSHKSDFPYLTINS